MSARFLVVDEMDGVWGRADTPVEAEKIRREETEGVGDNRYRLRVVEVEQHRPNGEPGVRVRASFPVSKPTESD